MTRSVSQSFTRYNSHFQSTYYWHIRLSWRCTLKQFSSWVDQGEQQEGEFLQIEAFWWRCPRKLKGCTCLKYMIFCEEKVSNLTCLSHFNRSFGSALVAVFQQQWSFAESLNMESNELNTNCIVIQCCAFHFIFCWLFIRKGKIDRNFQGRASWRNRW